MPVQQHVLNWLYSVLTSEYHDVNRTYNDIAQALARYPSLSPRTDVHTFPNGSSALLVHLTGTLPVNFRGSTYRFPMSIWVPHAYPREAPLIYVTPTATMMVRPGQHVDPQGQVYHPYLVGWVEFWDKSTIHDFLAILSDIFAKEPPVIARQAPPPQTQPQSQPQSPTPAHVQSPPPRPPLPPEMTPRTDSRGEPRPPPPPPKPHEEARQAAASRHDSGPPLPPLPNQASPPSRRASRYDSAPPLPPQAQTQAQGPRSPPTQPHFQPPNQQWMGQHPPPSAAMSPAAMQYHAQGAPHPPPPSQAQARWSHNGPPPAWNQGPPPPQAQPAPPPPPPDLLDEPLTVSVPSQTPVEAPPIPPNPEKDALLAQLASTLHSMRQQSRQQNESSMAGLQAQRTAMLSVIPTIQSEMGQLNQLSNMLTSNTHILNDALQKADRVVEGSKDHPLPDIDELLVAPTVVANQLYNLVAEERALGDAIFMLGRAMERGRISPAVFAKMTRSLAREWYMKKALVLEIGKGMGLAS